jgi:hypothetical protein
MSYSSITISPDQIFTKISAAFNPIKSDLMADYLIRQASLNV